jgi:N-acetylneuraminic acid mutarotase
MPKLPKLFALASIAVALLVVINTPLSSLAQGQWSAVDNLTPRLKYGVATVGSKVLIAGGEKYVGGKEGIAYFDQVDLYDTATGAWSSAKLSEPRAAILSATVGSRAFLYGRHAATDYADNVDIYDNETDSWSVTHLPAPVGIPAMFAIRDQVVIVGSPKGPGGSIANVYDPATDSWTATRLPDRPTDPIVLVAGDVALIGGGAGGDWDTLDLYDASAQQWSTLKLSQARADVSTAVVGSQILIAGGFVRSTPSGPSDVVDIFDTSMRTLTTAHLSEARFVDASVVVDGKALFAGGGPQSYGRGGLSTTVDVFDSTTGAWSVTQMPHQIWRPQAAAVGTHALIGGISPDSSTGPSPVDVYDASTGSWSTATLSDARQYVHVETMGRQALFLGGSFPGMDRSLRENSDVVDIYDEPTGTWTTGHLQAGREVQQVAVVGSQAVIVGGRRGCQGCDGGQLFPIVDIYAAEVTGNR